MKLNTNSNAYIIIYSTILVLIVAFLLAFVSSSLKGQQDKNVALDTRKQILYSLNMRDTLASMNDDQINAFYEQVVTKTDSVADEKGKKKANLYYATVNGEQKYVLPLKGQGMWGGISCFLALNADKNTVYGAYFNHESETAGLGAEIKDSQAWQEKFIGKQIWDESGNVVLSIVKKVEDPATQVDVVTGATLTSNGVDAMLKDGLKNVKPKAEEE